jgi:hypothetical protein
MSHASKSLTARCFAPRWPLLFLVALLANCWDGATRTDNRAANDDSSNVLSVRSARKATTIGGRSVQEGRFFAVLALSLQNTTQHTLKFSLESFSLVVDGAEVAAASETLFLANSCMRGSLGFLPAGASYSCEVAFDLSAAPERLTFSSAFEGVPGHVRFDTRIPAFAPLDDGVLVPYPTKDDEDWQPPSSEHCERCEGVGCMDLENEPLRYYAARCEGLRIIESSSAVLCDDACRSTGGRCLMGQAQYTPPNASFYLGLGSSSTKVPCAALPPATRESMLFGTVGFRRIDCLCRDECSRQQ